MASVTLGRDCLSLPAQRHHPMHDDAMQSPRLRPHPHLHVFWSGRVCVTRLLFLAASVFISNGCERRRIFNARA
jgi:hypothetical protein